MFRAEGATYFAPRPKGLAPSARRGKVSKGAVKGKPFRLGFLLTIPFLNDQEGLSTPLDSPLKSWLAQFYHGRWMQPMRFCSNTQEPKIKNRGEAVTAVLGSPERAPPVRTLGRAEQSSQRSALTAGCHNADVSSGGAPTVKTLMQRYRRGSKGILRSPWSLRRRIVKEGPNRKGPSLTAPLLTFPAGGK